MVHCPTEVRTCLNGGDLVIHVKRDESATFHWKRGCKVVRNKARTVGATSHSPCPTQDHFTGEESE